MWFAHAAKRDAGQDALHQRRLARVSDHASPAVVQKLTRLNRIDADTVMRPLDGQLAGQLIDAALARAISQIAASQRGRTGDRAHVNDAAAARLGNHALAGRASEQEIAG